MKANYSIVEKIKKLLALADGSQNQNQHERESAMQFAMDLLAKHNLTIAELEGSTLESTVSGVEGDFRLEVWARIVIRAACILYYTDFYTSTRYDYLRETSRQIPVFVGTTDNIAVTIEVSSWLLNSVRLESNRVYRTAYERRSFRLGAADKLLERAKDMLVEEKSQQTAATTRSSLMVMRNKLERANKEYLSTLNLRPSRSRASYVNSEAYGRGEIYGNLVNLSRQQQYKVLQQFHNHA